MKIKLRNLAVGMGLGLVILLFLAGAFTFSYYSAFIKSSGLTFSELSILARTGFLNRNNYNDREIPFLFLGLDRREDALENTLLTDTVLLGSLDTSNGRIKTVALPRDLWIPELKTKINALYFYGQKRPGSSGIRFTEEEITRITGIPPAFTIVLNYLELPVLIDTLGAVSVPVENTFEDSRYPNPAYIEGVSGAEPYMTVRFEQGLENMDGDRALVFIRSRGSADPLEGSDAARSRRQMAVLEALMEKLKSKEVLQNPTVLGKLYRFWKDRVETTISDSDIVSLGLSLGNKSIYIGSVQIPVDSAGAVLVNPPVSKYGLWVWEARDPSWEELREFVNSNL